MLVVQVIGIFVFGLALFAIPVIETMLTNQYYEVLDTDKPSDAQYERLENLYTANWYAVYFCYLF